MESTGYLGASRHHAICENFILKEEPINVFGRDEILNEITWLDMKNCCGVIHPTTFSHLPNLNYINMMDCNITKFLPKSFACLKKLSSLDMRNSNFPAEKEVFEGCKLSNLCLSDLNHLSNSALNYLNNLELLSLENCKISLSKVMFLEKESLKNLKISNCQITIDYDSFDNLSNLEDLDINSCVLNDFDYHIILKLCCVKRLALIDNELNLEINYELFGNLPVLETILFDKAVYKNMNFEKYPKLRKVQIPLKDTSSADDDLIVENLKSKNIEFEFISYGNLEHDKSNIQICA